MGEEAILHGTEGVHGGVEAQVVGRPLVSCGARLGACCTNFVWGAAEVVLFGGAFLKRLQLTLLLRVGDEMAGWRLVAREVRHDHNCKM